MNPNPASDSESRLKRAGELSEFLRQNPKQAKRDADELASQFGLNAALVAQIQSSVSSRVATNSTERKSLADRLKTLLSALLQFAKLGVSRPYAFQMIAAGATAIAGLSSRGGVATAIATWLALQAWCLLLKPRFRYSAFGSLFVGVIAGAMFFQVIRREQVPMPIPWQVISGIFGITMAVMNLFLGGILLVLGGSIQIAAEKRKSASLSRQDLIIRMFELQEQLDLLPSQPPKTLHPWIAFARKRPVLAAAVAMFATASLEHTNALLFHVDPFALQQAQAVQQAHSTKVGIVSISPGISSGAFLMVESLIGIFAIAIRIGLGLLANSWKKVWQTGLGMLAGFIAATAWAIPAKALGSMPLAMALSVPIQESISALFLILIVRFAVGFNRALTTYRAGDKPDEASIVGELLEIRYRLSANPATICVLVVDAAGSTQMKKVEDQLRVEYSFGRYQNWIGHIVQSNGGKVEMRTGDGAICAFGSAELALAAAQQIQMDIVRFNETENKLDLPFRLRVALHAGLVQADLDKVQFTEVIDVAAHTEKHSPIGGIALTEAFLRVLKTAPTLSVCATVDGFKVHAFDLTKKIRQETFDPNFS